MLLGSGAIKDKTKSRAKGGISAIAKDDLRLTLLDASNLWVFVRAPRLQLIIEIIYISPAQEM